MYDKQIEVLEDRLSTLLDSQTLLDAARSRVLNRAATKQRVDAAYEIEQKIRMLKEKKRIFEKMARASI